MEGIGCSERSIIPKKCIREKVDKVIESDFSKASLNFAIKALKGESDCCDAICGVLEYLKTLSDIPELYKSLLKELRKDSPIISWLPSYVQSDTQLLQTFLFKKCEVFENLENTAKFSQAFPYLARITKQFLKWHSSKYLPDHLTSLLLSLINLRERVNIKAEKRAVKRSKPKDDHRSAQADCYPNMPEHTVENIYKADSKVDKEEDKNCSKIYNSKSDITGGITHISCKHGVVKGFTALHRGESALQVNQV